MCVNVVVIICMYYVGERKLIGKKIIINKFLKSMKYRMFFLFVIFMNDLVCFFFKYFNWIDVYLFEYTVYKKKCFLCYFKFIVCILYLCIWKILLKVWFVSECL